MIKLEGTIINVFTQQGGKDKKQVKHLQIVTRFNYWENLNSQMVIKKMN